MRLNNFPEFATKLDKVYNALNNSENYNPVPIYKIRREIGDLVSRQNFDTWMIAVRRNNMAIFLNDDLPDDDPEKIKDSLKDPKAGLLTYMTFSECSDSEDDFDEYD